MPFSFGIIVLIKQYVFSLEVCILVVQLYEKCLLCHPPLMFCYFSGWSSTIWDHPTASQKREHHLPVPPPTFPSCLWYLGACCSSLPQPVQLTQQKTAPPLKRNGFLVGWWPAQTHRGVWGARELAWTEEGGCSPSALLRMGLLMG